MAVKELACNQLKDGFHTLLRFMLHNKADLSLQPLTNP